MVKNIGTAHVGQYGRVPILTTRQIDITC